MGGGGAFGYNQQKSNSQSQTGLRGTAYEDAAAGQAYRQGSLMSNLNQQLFSSPGATMDLGRQMIGSGKYGLGDNADAGVEALGKYQFGQTSAAGAGRGMLNPENQGAIVGSSIQNMLPFLIPQMQQHQYAQFAAPQSLLQSAKTSADYWSRALGGSSEASGSGFGFNVEAQGGATGSDRLIKYMITRVGTHILNIGLYLFRYLPQYQARWGTGVYLGVMADEVLQVCPQAISYHPDGYMMVNYQTLRQHGTLR